MLKNEIYNYAEILASFIRKKEFEPVTQRIPYYHMGATITDSILQAGLNYRHVVYPRVLSLLTKYPNYRTTCDFIILMQVFPLSELIDWKNEKKLQRIIDLSKFFFDNGIENEDNLSLWLGNVENLGQLKKINGVGAKTVDYLKMLSGNQALAIDRHLFAFLELAGIFYRTYQEANTIYSKASELLGLNKYELDRQVWLYMSEKKGY